jgi:GntR family transcriptional regulator
VILEHRYIVARFCPDLSAADLEGSLYALWTDKYGLDIVGADQTIRAVPIRDREARLLGVRSGVAGLLVISTGYLSGDVPLWWEQTLYRGDAYEFHNRLGPIRTARPAAGTLRDLE